MVNELINCSNCGEKIADDANFCPKCGTKTAKGRAANAVYPSDELREAFYSVGTELEKAFNIAAARNAVSHPKSKRKSTAKTSAGRNCCLREVQRKEFFWLSFL